MTKKQPQSVIPVERIANQIYLIRGEKVMLDFDLADLYGVPTKVLNQAVSRNKDRFPEDFMFKLSGEETEAINQSQFVTGLQKHRDPRYPPRAFTQEGISMLSSVLRSKQAIQISIAIMRTFVRMREILATHKDLASTVNKHDRQIATLYEHIGKLLSPKKTRKKPIGYIWPED